jgi:hypothetical protein
VYKVADRTKWFWIEHFKAFLDVLMLLEDHAYGVKERNAKCLFFWSQSLVRDELRDGQRAVSLLYPDFVEVRVYCYHEVTTASAPEKPSRPTD